MTTAYLLDNVPVRQLDNNGNPVAGALLHTWTAGTTTPLASYTDATATTPLPNPVVADSQGFFPQVWLLSSAYDLQARKPDDTTVLWTALNVNPGGQLATMAAALSAYIASVASSIGASLMGHIQAGVGAIARTVQAELRDMTKPEQFGAVGDGTTDDSAAIAKMITAIAANLVPRNVYLRNSYYLPAGVYDWSALGVGGISVSGPGKFTAPSVSVQGQPSVVLKFWGTVGTATAYGSTIAAGAASFTVANSFAVEQLLLLSNFPTDGAGADAFTNGSADLLGRVQRNHTVTSTSSLRQGRRKEIVQVATAGSPFKIYSGARNAYTSTQALQFQPISPVRGVRFTGVTFENIWLDFYLCDAPQLIDCTMLSTMVLMGCCHHPKVTGGNFNARAADVRIDAYEACTAPWVDGKYRGHSSPADNGVVKINGCNDCHVDVHVEGGLSAMSHGVMIDTNYSTAPSGYTDLPSSNPNGRVQAGATAGIGLVLSTDPYAAPCIGGRIEFVSGFTSFQVKGFQGTVVDDRVDFVDGSGFSCATYGTTGVMLTGMRAGNVFQGAPIANPRNGAQTQGDSALQYNQEGTFSPTVTFGGAAVGVTYSASNYGHYSRRGLIYTIKGALVLTSKGTSTGALRIGGLPSAAEAGAFRDAAGAVGQTSGFASLTGPILLTVDQGATTMALLQQGAAGTTQLQNTNVTDAAWAIFQTTYNVS